MTSRIVNLKNTEHQKAFFKLLNAYMLDDMGLNAPLDENKGQKIVADLLIHPSYVGFFVKENDEFIALANCFVNYSTFSARQLINIHDFVVASEYRCKGAGYFLLSAIEKYGQENDFCRINLEVREDNVKARSLYYKYGFRECSPAMSFWEKWL